MKQTRAHRSSWTRLGSTTGSSGKLPSYAAQLEWSAAQVQKANTPENCSSKKALILCPSIKFHLTIWLWIELGASRPMWMEETIPRPGAAGSETLRIDCIWQTLVLQQPWEVNTVISISLNRWTTSWSFIHLPKACNLDVKKLDWNTDETSGSNWQQFQPWGLWQHQEISFLPRMRCWDLYLLGRGQGCCLKPSKTGDHPHSKKNTSSPSCQ